MPILCVDGIVMNAKRQVLLVKRKNEPFRNQWWVPGGRVHKGESLARAFERKMKEELGIRVRDVRPVGYFEGRRLGSGTWGIDAGVHAVSVVFAARAVDGTVCLDGQSADWGYFDELPKRFKVVPFGGGRGA